MQALSLEHGDCLHARRAVPHLRLLNKNYALHARFVTELVEELRQRIFRLLSSSLQREQS